MVFGIQTLETGVFGGIIVGIMACKLQERFFRINLPAFLGFFGGLRFVPIICAVTSIFLGASLKTAPGGSEIVNGQLIEGTQRIFFAELVDPSVKKFFEGTS